MSKVFQVFDTESGRIVSTIKRVAEGVKLAAAALVATNPVVNVTSTDGLWPGMLLTGKGVVPGTTVSSVDTQTSFTMSANASASGTGLFVVGTSYIPYLSDGTVAIKEVHLEHFRDFFDDTTTVGIRSQRLAGPPIEYFYGVKTLKAAVIPGDPAVVFGGPTGADAGATTFIDVFTDNPAFSISDHVAHEPPREQVQKCSFVHFILDDGTLLPVLRMPAYDIVSLS